MSELKLISRKQYARELFTEAQKIFHDTDLSALTENDCIPQLIAVFSQHVFDKQLALIEVLTEMDIDVKVVF